MKSEWHKCNPQNPQNRCSVFYTSRICGSLDDAMKAVPPVSRFVQHLPAPTWFRFQTLQFVKSLGTALTQSTSSNNAQHARISAKHPSPLQIHALYLRLSLGLKGNESLMGPRLLSSLWYLTTQSRSAVQVLQICRYLIASPRKTLTLFLKMYTFCYTNNIKR